MHVVIENESPPGGWRYKDADTGVWIKTTSYGLLFPAVRNHRIANGLPVPANLRKQIDKQVCELVPTQWCERETPVNHRQQLFSLAEVVQGTATIWDWAMHKAEFVDQAEADRRAFICSRCHFNQDIAGCANCARRSLTDMITKIVGDRVTATDGQLNSCTVCGCNLKAKVWFPLDILQRNTPDSQKADYPDFCWLKGTNEPRTNTTD